jgi:ABC-type Fe3+/spermidine/putrescine transport system ATPase subunit
VTHDFDEAYFLGDEITICIDGKVKQVGKKDDVFLRPKSREVAQFLGARNLYRATVLEKEDHRWILAVNGLRLSVPEKLYPDPVQPGKEVDLFIRSEEVMIIREGKAVKDTLKRNILDGDIFDIVDRGRHHVVHFQTREGNILFEVSIPSYVFRNLHLSPGKKVRVALRDESLWVMD